MAPLTTKERAALPDSAFAYIDAAGRRRLPINDLSHVRNALSRFNQTTFESSSARDRARTRLLRAAKRYGIVPLGFMEGQLRGSSPPALPTGVVTLLFADVEDSTGLVRLLGDRYGSFLAALRSLLRAAVQDAGGLEVDARADELFAVFVSAAGAVAAARAIQGQVWPDGVECRLRIGLHTGEPALSDQGYVGLPVHVAARVCALAGGNQVLLTQATLDALPDRAVVAVGERRLRGLPAPEMLYALSL